MADDFGSLFSNYQITPVAGLAPSATPVAAASTTDSILNAFNNPTLQLLLASAGGAMAPKDFAGNFANALKPAIQSRAMAEALKSMQVQNVASAPAPTPTEPMVNPLDKAKELSTASSILKKAAEIRPDVVPGFGDMLKTAANTSPQSIGGAFATKPELAPNPTVPVGSVFSEQPPAGATPSAQALPSPKPFAFDLSPDLAGAMTPEQIVAIYTYGSTQKKQELEIQKQINDNLMAPLMRGETAARAEYLAGHGKLANVEAMVKAWENTPEGRAWQIKKVTAPVEAQAEVDAKKRDFSIKAIQTLLGDNWNSVLPGFPISVGQMATLGAISPHSGDTVANVFNALARVQEAKANHAATQARIAFDKKAVEEDRAMRSIATLDARLNDLIKRPAERDFPNTPEGKSALQLARMNGQVRTREQDAQIEEIQRQRKSLYDKVPGLIYSPIPVSSAATQGAVPADQKKLDEIKKQMKTTNPSNPNFVSDFINIFNPGSTAGPRGGGI